MIKYFTLIFISIILFAFTGCNIINPAELVPTYIHVDSFKFINTNPGYYGSSSHDINTVFATYNGMEIGVFELPCNIPIQASGKNTLILSPGIAVNGFSAQEAAYPFYNDAIDTLIPQPGKIINYTPATGYIGNTKIVYLQNFDVPGTNFTSYDGDTSVNITNVTNNPAQVFEGSGSGLLYFSKANDSVVCASKTTFAIASNTPVLCEVNYKSTVPIAIGLIPVSVNSTTGQQTFTNPQYNNLAFAPSATWKKAYINIAEIVSQFPANYYFLVIKGAEITNGQAGGYALFDNIKVVTSK